MDRIDEIAAFEGRIAKVAGCGASGKTEALVQRCARLLADGADPQRICVAVSSAAAVQAFRARLQQAVGDALAAQALQTKITTALDLAVETLNTPAAREATSRTPRLLMRSEYTFLLEDMKTTGEGRRKLRGMLGYIYGQWTGIPEGDNWLVGEEKTIHDQLLSNLRSMGATLPEEAPLRAIEYLRGAGLERPYTHLLADDFQNFCRAEQQLLSMLASEQFIVCGNTAQTVPAGTGHACPEGFESFDKVRRNVELFALEEPLTVPKLSAVKWGTPEQEMNELTKIIRLAFDREAERDDGARESSICVVAPNKRWASMLDKVLHERGFKTSTALMRSGIGGDPRELKRARALVAATKLNLLADPHDMVAWRAWCGLGNYLTNSDAWLHLREYAAERDLGLEQALAEMAKAVTDGGGEPFLRAGALAERWKSGQDFIAAHARRRGFALLAAIGAQGLPEFSDVERELSGKESAAELFALVRRWCLDPQPPTDPHVLHIAAPGALTGTHYDAIVFTGCIDGFLPAGSAFEVISTDEARERAMDAERCKFADTIAKAGKRVVFSYFAQAPLELAERTKMKVMRVKAVDGERIALVHPSVLLEELDEQRPPTKGGQALLAEYGLA